MYKDTFFLSNDAFIRWQLFRDPQQEAYWHDFIAENPDAREALDSAIQKFAAVRINDYRMGTGHSASLQERIATTVRLRRKRRIVLRYTAAACLLAVLGTGLLMHEQRRAAAPLAAGNITGIIMDSEDIRLVAGDAVKVFENDACIDLASPATAQIMPQTDEGAPGSAGATINRLIVPFGKRTSLLLPDGSRAWVNAGTELLIPSAFDNGHRTLEVVKGEIFLDVAKDPSRPFIVRTPEFEVEVLGTRFNVSAYPDDTETSVGLIEGRITIKREGRQHQLVPGDLFCLAGNAAAVTRPADLEGYSAWKDGLMVLDGTPIADILRKIGRYHNIVFNYSDSLLASRKCSGKLILSDRFEELLTVLCCISGTTSEISGNNVLIRDNPVNTVK